MTKTKDIEQLRRRSEKIYSNGKILDYNLFGDTTRKKYYQQYDRSPYSQVQNFLYKRAIFGLSIFGKEEIKEMHPNKRHRIIKVHKRAQRELNLWKQNIVIQNTNRWLKLFPNSPLAQDIINTTTTDPTVKNKLSFDDLGITKDEVVDKLLKAGILPNNFYELKK